MTRQKEVRARAAYLLRQAGWKWDDIGLALKVSRTRAAQLAYLGEPEHLMHYKINTSPKVLPPGEYDAEVTDVNEAQADGVSTREWLHSYGQ